MNEEEKSIKLLEFQQLTGCDQSIAAALLDASNWDIELASTLFFDDSRSTSSPPPQIQLPQSHQPQASRASTTSKPKQSGGIRTLSDFNKDDDDSDEDDDHNTYYAGGEKSGIQVKAPKADEVAHKISETATKYGVQPHEIQKSNVFEGTGHILGSQPNAPSAVVKKQPQEVNKVLTLYSNGFVVDNGPLRTFDQPANKKFLEDVYRGIIPDELEKDIGGAVLNLSFVDNKDQVYVPPKQAFQPFSSAGRTLSEKSAVTPDTSSVAKPTSAKSLQIDDSNPTTTLQIRLHDGTRLVAKFNHNHTIQDLTNFILSAKPLGGRAFNLMQPPRQPVPSDPSKTLAEAGLLNAVVIQHLV